MGKTAKIIFTISAINIILLLALFVYSKNKTFTNTDDYLGNTTGNIYNGGLFCEFDDKIYFSNPNDDGRLYVMDSNALYVKPLYNDRVAYINVDANHIYYLRTNNKSKDNQTEIFFFNNSGIYRINNKGKNLKLISNLPGAYVKLKGNSLFFQQYLIDKGTYFFTNNTDATEEFLLKESPIIPGDIIGQLLFYSDSQDSHQLKTLDLKRLNSKIIIDKMTSMPIINGSYIYYLDLEDNYSIHRSNLDGTQATKIVASRCSTYNINENGRYLYYQIDDGENNSLSCIDLQTMEKQTIMKGNFNHIHITKNFAFFQEFDSPTTYKVLIGRPENVSAFNPTNHTSE